MFEKLKRDVQGMVDIGIIITIGIVFAGLMVGAYILWTLYTQLLPAAATISTAAGRAANAFRNQSYNITHGFDNAVTLILVAVTIFILALAIASLMMLRGRQE